jgi:PAS domain S-box-containing protein
MRKKHSSAMTRTELRRLAEEQVALAKEREPKDSVDIPGLLHELQVHKVELEMQNEALRESYQQAERALARFTDLYDFAPIGYVTVRRDGTIRQINLAGARLLGAGRATLLNQPFAASIHEYSRRSFAEFMAKVWASDTKQGCEISIPAIDNYPAKVAYVEAIRDESGIEARLIVKDITARKQAEASQRLAMEEAERANRAKSRFLAAASHDLRQPLAGLALYIAAVENKLAKTDGQLVSGMKNCVATLSEMLSHLLDLSKLDAGVVLPKVENFELDTVLQKVVSSFMPAARAKGLELRYAGCGFIGSTDPVLFQRLIGNLVDNAIRYTEKGAVLIGCRRRQGKVWVEVWDTGIGIPEDKTGEIFEEFKQLGNEERNRAKGTGLGLAIVAKMATLLGLQVRVRSRVGKGSVFSVELPLGEAVKPVVEAPYIHQPLKIALVEDNVDVAKAMVYALTDIGHQVITGASSAELLSRLEETPPDLLISDYRLSENENGFNVIAALRAHFAKKLPALIMTGDTDPEVIRRMAREQIVVLHKPLDLNVLRLKIAELTAPA